MQPEYGCTNAIRVPAIGETESSRDGRKYIIKSVFVSGNVTGGVMQDQADVQEAPQCFVALVLDPQANAATIVSEQVYTNPNDSAFVNMRLHRNLQYTSRYKVVAWKRVNLGPVVTMTDGASTSSQRVQARAFTLSWHGTLPVQCVGTTADVASVTDNAFHVIAFATTTDFVPLLTYNARTRFIG